MGMVMGMGRERRWEIRWIRWVSGLLRAAGGIWVVGIIGIIGGGAHTRRVPKVGVRV